MSTPISCQAILHQALQRRAGAHRVGDRAAEAFPFDGDHALRVRRLQRRGVETDAGAAARRVGAATKPQRQVDRLLGAWQPEIRIAQYAPAAGTVGGWKSTRLDSSKSFASPIAT